MELLEADVRDEADLAFPHDPAESVVEQPKAHPKSKGKRHPAPTQPMPPAPKLDRDGRCSCGKFPDPLTGICPCGYDYHLGAWHIIAAPH